MAEKLSKLFRIDFYPHEWLTDTGSLTLEECGLYIQIICLIYAKRGPIPNNPKEISKKLENCSIRKARALIDSLLDKGFIQLSGEKITQKRAESELKTKRNHLETSSKGGRNRSENKDKINNNNNLSSSDNTNSLASLIVTVDSNSNKELKPSVLKEGEKYAFNGEVIRLTRKDRDSLFELYDGNADQFYDFLDKRDEWYKMQAPEKRKGWFMATKKYLEKLGETK